MAVEHYTTICRHCGREIYWSEQLREWREGTRFLARICGKNQTEGHNPVRSEK